MTCLVTLVLLWLNVAAVRTIHRALAATVGGVFKNGQVEQAFMLMVPAALLFVQWWLWEIIAEWIRPDEPPTVSG